jgi:hypothetical protein
MSASCAANRRRKAATWRRLGRRLAADVEADVLAAGGFERRHQAPAAETTSERWPGGDQRRADFQGGALDAAAGQRRQQLHDGQPAHARAGPQPSSTKTAPQ